MNLQSHTYFLHYLQKEKDRSMISGLPRRKGGDELSGGRGYSGYGEKTGEGKGDLWLIYSCREPISVDPT